MNRLVPPEVRRTNVLTLRGGGGARAAFQSLAAAVAPPASASSSHRETQRGGASPGGSGGHLDSLAVRAALSHRPTKGRAPLLDKLFLGACQRRGLSSGLGAAPCALLGWQADAVVSRLDSSGDGLVTYDEFERFVLPPRGRAGVRAAVKTLLDAELDPPGSVGAGGAVLCRANERNNASSRERHAQPPTQKKTFVVYVIGLFVMSSFLLPSSST
jgi:hypothetical protein